METDMNNISIWLDKHYKKREKILINLLKKYDIPYSESNGLYFITHKEYNYIYIMDSGRWKRVGQKKYELYHSQNPKQFIIKYILHLPYEE